MNPKVNFQLTCSNQSVKGKIQGRVSADMEIYLLGMARRILEKDEDMKHLSLDRLTITLVMPKRTKAKAKK